MSDTAPRLPKILFYGDSNTYGWHEQPDGVVVRWPEELTWPGRLRTLLAHRAQVEIDGLSGRTSAFDRPPALGNGTGRMPGVLLNGVTWLPAALSRVMPVNILVVMLGTNDFNYQLNKTADEATDGIRQLIDIAQQNTCWREVTPYQPPKILVIAPPHIELAGTPNEKYFPHGDAPSAVFAQHLEHLVKEKGIHFYDAATVVPVAHDADGVHLSLEDHAALAAGVLPVLEAMLAELE